MILFDSEIVNKPFNFLDTITIYMYTDSWTYSILLSFGRSCYYFLYDIQILCSIYQGLENSWANHKKCAEMLHRGVESLGLELLVTEKVGLISIIPLYVKY